MYIKEPNRREGEGREAGGERVAILSSLYIHVCVMVWYGVQDTKEKAVVVVEVVVI